MNSFCKKRREFLKILGMGAAALTIPGFKSAPEAQEMKHNILFLFTDDQRFDTIHALGNEHIITPNIDYLVKNGTTFTNAYIMGSMSGAVCMPSRAMLMTGRTLFHLEGSGNIIPEEHVTFPETLQKGGYRTFATGKWHQDRSSFNRSFPEGARIFGFAKGWYKTYGGHWNIPVHDFDPAGKYPEEKAYIAGGPNGAQHFPVSKDVKEGKHSSELFSDAAIQFLRDYKGEKPFFMYVSYVAPHDPRQSPEKYLDMYDPEKIPLPDNFLPKHPFDNGELDVRDEQLEKWPRTPKAIRRHIADYYAIITHADAQIGRVLNALKETGHFENTIIIFTGDNGLAVGRHGLMGKQNVYEHSAHVPLIMSGPGIPAGEKRDTFCYLLDIFPTLCDLTGIPIPNSVDGKSLAPVIKGEQEKIRKSLFFAYKNFQRGIRTERWKMILYNVNGTKTTQLFDLQNDPHETKNLTDDPDHAYLIHGLTALIKDWIKETGDRVDLDKPDWGVPVIPSWQNMMKQMQSR